MSLPEEVYMVTRIPPESEKAPWYGHRRLSRIYRNIGHAKTFVNANQRSEFKIWKGTVVWEEVDGL